jgi:hypothetical protein
MGALQAGLALACSDAHGPTWGVFVQIHLHLLEGGHPEGVCEILY